MNSWSHRFSQNTNTKLSRVLPSLHRAEILTIFCSYFGLNDYSRASRYTASSCTDLAGAGWIGSKNIWDARFCTFLHDFAHFCTLLNNTNLPMHGFLKILHHTLERKKCKHFVFNKYFCLVLGLLKSRI